MKKIGKILFSAGLALALLVSGSFSSTSIFAPKHAAADMDMGLEKYVKGTFGRKTTGTVAFSKNDYDKPVKTFSLLFGRIESSSAAKGVYTVQVQIRKNSKTPWRTIQTVTAKKNGTTNFEVNKIYNHYQYRFLLTNPSTLKPIKFNLSWIQWGNSPKK